jgi:hypothetical protein
MGGEKVYCVGCVRNRTDTESHTCSKIVKKKKKTSTRRNAFGLDLFFSKFEKCRDTYLISLGYGEWG